MTSLLNLLVSGGGEMNQNNVHQTLCMPFQAFGELVNMLNDNMLHDFLVFT